MPPEESSSFELPGSPSGRGSRTFTINPHIQNSKKVSVNMAGELSSVASSSVSNSSGDGNNNKDCQLADRAATNKLARSIMKKQSSKTPEEYDDDNDFSESAASTAFDATPKLTALQKERQSLASSETQWIRVLRVVTLLVLMVTAALLAYAVYAFGRNSQQSSFVNEYEAHANQVIESFHAGVGRQLAAFDTLSASITGYALTTQSTFPNVTLPHWGIMANNFQIQAQATWVQFMPLVPGTDENDSQREMWQKYSSLQRDWLMPAFLQMTMLRMAQDLKFGYQANALTGSSNNNETEQQQKPLDFSHLPHGNGFSPYIWSSLLNGASPAFSGPYFPLWQMAPVLPILTILNLNAGVELDFYAGITQVVAKQGKASLGVISPFKDDGDEKNLISAMLDASLKLGPFRHVTEDYENDPVTFFGYPVFDRYGDNPDGTPRNVVGILYSGLFWRILFQDLLPPSAQGITVVLKNTLGQVETYRIDGSIASYVGSGDHHDAAYDDKVESASIIDYIASRASPQTESYVATGLSGDYVQYEMFVYPSYETEAQYTNNEPIIYAIAVGCIFVFVAAVFLLYNYLVERRQRMVMDKAVRSAAVVQSLFPENVQQRLYAEQDEKEAGRRVRESWMLQESSGDFQLDDDGNPTKPSSSHAPIADLFPESTVFFADLVGFTEWSSGRQPVEVFGLLESIYSKFDAIALRRKVFKVETIGDCYVACCGIPDPQPDHALIAAKFASECLVTLHQLLSCKLSRQYGGNTQDLSLRIGLHSGPVTAGVLRGVKGRFQLFGDTVNTAARMESTGSPGRIQCTEATAALLQSAGKGDWTKEREELVVAKGKGELKTYWIEVTSGRRSQKSIDDSDRSGDRSDRSGYRSH